MQLFKKHWVTKHKYVKHNFFFFFSTESSESRWRYGSHLHLYSRCGGFFCPVVPKSVSIQHRHFRPSSWASRSWMLLPRYQCDGRQSLKTCSSLASYCGTEVSNINLLDHFPLASAGLLNATHMAMTLHFVYLDPPIHRESLYPIATIVLL